MYVTNALGYVLIVEQLAGRRVPRRRFAGGGRVAARPYVPGNVVMVASRLVLGQEAGISRKVSLAGERVRAGAVARRGVRGRAAPARRLRRGRDRRRGVARGARPLGLVVLHPSLFGRFTGWALRRAKREPLEVLLTGRQVLALLAWYLLGAVLLALGIGLLVHSAVGNDGGSLLYVGLSFLTSFVVSMLAFIFPSGLGAARGRVRARARAQPARRRRDRAVGRYAARADGGGAGVRRRRGAARSGRRARGRDQAEVARRATMDSM